MKSILRIILILFIFNSCKKEEPLAFYIDCGVEITVKNKDGKDLLNPLTPGALLSQNIKIYYLINGVKKEVNYGNYVNPQNFNILELDGIYRMRLILNQADPISTTYIQWNASDTDTLKSQIYRPEGLITCKGIWFNDSLVWSWENYSKERSFEIVK